MQVHASVFSCVHKGCVCVGPYLWAAHFSWEDNDERGTVKTLVTEACLT